MSGAGPSRAADLPIAPDTAAICPYLLAAGGAWRASTASREHRCTAVVPPAVLAADKQRRLCLVADHATCSTYIAAQAAREAASGPIVGRGPRRAIPRTSPLVLDQGRLAVGLPGLPDRGVGQGGLVALMAVAFGALAVTRMTGGGPDAAPAAAGNEVSPRPSVVASTEPPATARPAVPAASGNVVPERTLVPSDAKPTPATAAASAGSTAGQSPAVGTYKVKSGDTLSGIAAAHGTTWRVLAELNDIKDAGKLRFGQVLTLP
jgi:nucleoid-associated protein YgaU